VVNSFAFYVAFAGKGRAGEARAEEDVGRGSQERKR